MSGSRALAVGGACTAFLIGLVGFVPGRDALAQVSPACEQTSAHYALTCYPASQVKLARRLFGARAINPSSAVYAETGLILSDVVTGTPYLPQPSTRVTLVTFDYGPVPIIYSGVEYHPVSPATWASVTVVKDRTAMRARAIVTRSLTVTGTPGGVTSSTQGPWEFQSTIPKLRLYVDVVTDGRKSMVAAIGCKLIKDTASRACQNSQFTLHAEARQVARARRDRAN